jgi:predicted RNA-binding Zn-ribbon protein involved in translation (DUF1610 family)
MDETDVVLRCWSCEGEVSPVSDVLSWWNLEYPDNCPHCGAEIYAELDGGTDSGFYRTFVKP